MAQPAAAPHQGWYDTNSVPGSRKAMFLGTLGLVLWRQRHPLVYCRYQRAVVDAVQSAGKARGSFELPAEI